MDEIKFFSCNECEYALKESDIVLICPDCEKRYCGKCVPDPQVNRINDKCYCNDCHLRRIDPQYYHHKYRNYYHKKILEIEDKLHAFKTKLLYHNTQILKFKKD